MVANKIRELISATRRSARNIRQALDDVAEQLIANQRQRQLEVQLERVPVRIPTKSHPLANRRARGVQFGAFGGAQRYYSTSRRAPVHLRAVSRSSVSSVTRNIVYQVQPFRVTFRAGCNYAPSSLYSNFTRHNARMYSTYGHTLASQAAHNLSQGLRASILKGHELQSKLMGRDSNGSQNANQHFVEHNMQLARAESETDGCVVEFSLKCHDRALPKKFLLDDEIMQEFENAYLVNEFEHRMLILSDIKRLKEIIGVTVIEHLDDRNLIRCHFPNCDVPKMETMLAESGIRSGVVKGAESRSVSMASDGVYSLSSADPCDSPDFDCFDGFVSSDSSASEDDPLFFFDEHPVLSSSEGLEFLAPDIPVSEIYSDMDAIIMVDDGTR
ncbi:hypothetical protein KL928_005089 [Ogataea angusta]|uniref:Uncharacterized protein n=1 Tax=Pichia angusta TaxID=870730 RepID=A0AAN6DCB3_PICAN|nr:uncharacterized protein KL928_005089 [Ogataea angusta]KAG7816123.1 hypothetical protein KL928_005089 [Ogataea angusta]